MIKNIENLSYQDKAFMLYNHCCFSLPTTTSISYYSSSWEEECKERLKPEELHFEEERIINVGVSANSALIALKGVVPTDSLYMDMNDMYRNLIRQCPCETNENICDFIAYASSMLRKLNTFRDKEASKVQFMTVFNTIFSWKIRAHEIYIKAISDSRPDDDVLWSFTKNSLQYLMNNFLFTTSEEYAALTWFLLCKNIGFTLEPSDIDFVSHMKGIVTDSIDVEKLHTYLTKLNACQMDALEIIGNISEDSMNPEFKEYSIHQGKQLILDSYKKNVVSIAGDDSNVFIGDNVNEEENFTFSEIARIVTELVEVVLPRNVKEPLSFTMQEREIGYLKHFGSIPMCKYITPDKRFFTIINFQHVMYLLFRKENDTDFYGIRIVKPGEVPSIRRFVIRDDVDYKLEVGSYE